MNVLDKSKFRLVNRLPGFDSSRKAYEAGEAVTVGISAVERDTGLSKDTLRVWERRYNFPQPGRDAYGERVYALDQVEKLRVIKRLMDRGFRPGKIIHHPVDELVKLGQQIDGASRSPDREEVRTLLKLIKSHDVDELRRSLSQAALKQGLARFVIDTVAPLSAAVGEAWMSGELEIFEEHLYTESIQVILRNAIASVPHHADTPRILLTTFPNEQHGLGLLMAESLMALEGAHCISLGVETPIWDIVLAADSQRADVVALSFSASYASNLILDGLAELRAKLPPHVEIWAGGAASVLVRRPPEEIRALRSLEAIHEALALWRTAHPRT
jgi:MerR family transcriptional regulator, light-induced transcriptional regulator